MRRNTLFPGLVVLLSAAASTAVAQNQVRPAQTVERQQSGPAQKPATAPIVVRTPVVIVPVTVKDSHGELVGGLTEDDFRIFADNVEQKIATFSSDAVPLSAVILVDNDLDRRVSPQVQKSLTAISAGFAPEDEAAFVVYDQQPETVFDFSYNNDALFTTLSRFEIGSHDNTVYADPAFPPSGPPPGWVPPPAPSPGDASRSYTAPNFKTTVQLTDAIFAAGEMLKSRGRDRRKIIFLISDESNSKYNAHSYDETLRSLLISDVSVYSISVSRSAPIGKKLVQRGALDLQKYAAATGGDTFYAGKQPDLERLYSEVTEQARNEYTLTFSPREVAKGQDYHPIEVRVKRPQLNIEKRDGYYQSAIAPGR